MIRLQTLPNGVRIATDRMDSVRSCSIGVWVEVGSRHERPREAGITHFIEHMLFKGTARHGALELADELDRLGGHFNAMTSQEAICLHAQSVDQKAPRAIELLTEMLLDSIYPEEEIARERNVILEEYKMYEDNPDDMIVDLFYKTLWPSSPLGRPIIGTPATIEKFSSRGIRDYLAREFNPKRILVVLAGSFDTKRCLALLKKTFGSLPSVRRASAVKPQPARAGTGQLVMKRKMEQVHFCFGGPGPDHASRDRYAFGLMNLILGGGMSSRLFKEVREKRGLVYSIHSFAQRFRGSGSFGVGGATSPATLSEVLTLCLAELERICSEEVGEMELQMAKEQIHDSILMSIESTSARMFRLSESMLGLGRPVSYTEILENVMKIDAGQIRNVARKYLSGRAMAGAFIGPKGTTMDSVGSRLKLRVA